MNVREQLLAIGQQVLCQDGFPEFVVRFKQQWAFWRRFFKPHVREIVFGYNGAAERCSLAEALVNDIIRTPLEDLWLKARTLNVVKNAVVSDRNYSFVSKRDVYRVKDLIVNLLLVRELLYPQFVRVAFYNGGADIRAREGNIFKLTIYYDLNDAQLLLKYNLSSMQTCKMVSGEWITFRSFSIHLPINRVHPEILAGIVHLLKKQTEETLEPLRQSQA